jgi:FdhD protein
MAKDRSLEWVEYTRVNAEVSRGRERVVAESALSISLNGRHFATVMITPLMEKEFIVGHLFGQGIIQSAADIASLTLKDNIAEATLTQKKGKAKEPAEIRSDFRVSREDIFAGVSAILKSRIYAETGAIHSAGLFKKGAEPVCITEDIGRHNALDKVIGYGLLNQIDFSQTFATSTGRMASDMVSKLCRAGIPVVATKTAVTKLGIEIGRSCGLTIIGFVRDGGMKIYTNPQRILQPRLDKH